MRRQFFFVRPRVLSPLNPRYTTTRPDKVFFFSSFYTTRKNRIITNTVKRSFAYWNKTVELFYKKLLLYKSTTPHANTDSSDDRCVRLLLLFKRTYSLL